MSNTPKNIPELRFPRFEDEWEENVLGEVVDVYDGTHQTPKYTNEGIKFLSVENIKTLDSDKYISKEAFEKEFKIRPEFGDILMTRIGNIGTPNIVKSNEDFAYYVSLALLKPKCINSYFLKTLILSPFIQNELWRKTLHVAFPKKINKNEIAKVMVNYPNKKEQEKIGDFFSKLDRQIELEEKKLELLEQQKKGYMQKIFSQKLRFKDANENHYPQWTLKNFKEVFKVVPSKKYQIKSSEVEDIANIPVVDQGQNLILGYSNNKEKIFKDFKNVIIYGDHTTFVKKLDKPFIIGGDGVKLLTSKTGIDINYLYNVLQYFNVKPEGYKRHFSILKTKYLYIATSIEEQKRIATLFNKIDKYIEKQFKKVELLKQRKQGLLQKMFI